MVLAYKYACVQAIEAHTGSLQAWLSEQLRGLRHDNGRPRVRLFGAHNNASAGQSCLFQMQVRERNIVENNLCVLRFLPWGVRG